MHAHVNGDSWKGFLLALHLGVGLFQNKPFGGWLDGWLPPVQGAFMPPTGAEHAWPFDDLAVCDRSETGRQLSERS